MVKGNDVGASRSDRHNLQMLTTFDVREEYAIHATTDLDLTSGTITSTEVPTGYSSSRAQYYYRSILNTSSSAITVYYKLVGRSKEYNQSIPAGNYFHLYDNVSQISSQASGSSNATVILCAMDKQIVDDRGAR